MVGTKSKQELEASQLRSCRPTLVDPGGSLPDPGASAEMKVRLKGFNVAGNSRQPPGAL